MMTTPRRDDRDDDATVPEGTVQPEPIAVPDWFTELGPVERWVDRDREPPDPGWWRGRELESWKPAGEPTVEQWVTWLAGKRWGEAQRRWLDANGLGWDDVEAGRPASLGRYASLAPVWALEPAGGFMPPGWTPGPPPGGWPR